MHAPGAGGRRVRADRRLGGPLAAAGDAGLFFCRGAAGVAVRPLQRRARPWKKKRPTADARRRRRWLPLVCRGLLLACVLAASAGVLMHNAWTGDFLSFLPDRGGDPGGQPGVAAPAEGEASRWNLEYSSFSLERPSRPVAARRSPFAGAVLVLAVYFREGRNVGASVARPAVGRPAPRPAAAPAAVILPRVASGTNARAGRTWRSFSTIRRA